MLFFEAKQSKPIVNKINPPVTLDRTPCQSLVAAARSASLTKRCAGVGPGNRRHDDEAEALVLSALDLHVVRLEGGGHHRTPAAAPAAAAYAAGGAAAWADGVERVLAPLGGPLALRQTRCLGAAVVGGGWWWRNVTLSFWHWRGGGGGGGIVVRRVYQCISWPAYTQKSLM